MALAFHIRAARGDDIPAIVALFGIVDDLHTAAVPWAFRGSSAVPRSSAGNAGSAPSIEELIAGPRTAILVAVAADRVVGHLVVELMTIPSDRPPHVARSFAVIHDLIVAPEARRQGIGRELIAEAERWAKERGVSAVELTVWSFNEDALRLYEELGYETQLRRLRRVIG
jgi:diamine N-acetyltransferase